RAVVGQEAEDAVDSGPADGRGDRLGREIAARLEARQVAGQRHGLRGGRRQPVGRPATGRRAPPREVRAPCRIRRGLPGAPPRCAACSSFENDTTLAPPCATSGASALADAPNNGPSTSAVPSARALR